MSRQTFEELIWVDLADAAAVSNTVTETVICPDFTFLQNDPRIYPGATWRVTCKFDLSNIVTSPGTLTFRQRWGGVSGTVMGVSDAIALDTTAHSNLTGKIELVTTWRTIGSAGSAMTIGEIFLQNIAADGAGAPNYQFIPAATPAVTSSLDTTASKALSVTAQFSVANSGNALVNHLRLLELLN